jgi:hypothetical protein
MNASEGFTKVDDQLIALGLPPRLVLLYGRLRFRALEDGWCYFTWKTLAEEIGVKHRITVFRLLRQLKALRLVKWEAQPGRYDSNRYQVLAPDVAFLQRQTLPKCNVSGVAKTQPKKEESSSKEEKKRSPLPPTPSPQGRGAPPRAKTARKPADPPRAPADAKTQNTSTQKIDDDGKPKPPEQEFRERLRERHGPLFDIDRCVEHVRKQLDKCAVPMADFVDYDAANTTAPDALLNPIGHYVQLAKALRHAALAAAHNYADDVLRRAAAAAPPEPERDSRGLCVRCHGPGVLADGTYCSCAMGRDLEGLARRDTAQPPKKAPTEAKKILDFPTKGA